MSCKQTGTIDCDTIQIIEPQDDLLVDTAGSTSDLDERGSVELTTGQTSAAVLFQVAKLNTSYNFEYLYVDAIGNVSPGGIQVIPSLKAIQGFTVLFAGSPIEDGYVLHWRVTIVRTSSLVQIDAPENLYLQMPQTHTMLVAFVNPRSSTNYWFTELRVENLTDNPGIQALIGVQVFAKMVSGFYLGVNPVPPSNNYFLRVRTP